MHQRTIRLFGTRELVAMLVGIVLYGVMSWATSFLGLSIGVNSSFSLRPAIVIPIIMGFLYGPVVGFGVGFFGNAMGDWLSFNNADIARISGAFTFWHFHIGNGLFGLVPGVYAMQHPSYRTGRELLAAIGVGVLGVVIGTLVATSFEWYLCRADDPAPWCRVKGFGWDFVIFTRFWPLVQTNIFNVVLLLPIVLYNTERIDFSNTDWLKSGLMRQILLAILIAAAIPTLLMGFFLFQQSSLIQELSAAAPASTAAQPVAVQQSQLALTVRLLFTVVVTLAFTLANASLVAQSLSRPLLRLTRAATRMQQDSLSAEEARELKDTATADEIGQLSRQFGRMAEEVVQREARLKQTIVALRIEIDEAKRQREVEEITGTDYFQDLQSKAATLRAKAAKAALAAASEAEAAAPPAAE